MSNLHRHAPACRVAARASAGLVALAILAGCGGGGGGNASASSTSLTPAPSLAITSDATSTTTAGASIALHAAQANSTSTPTWTLAGPGSLSAPTGTDIRYVPPDGESLAQAATAVVTASADGLSQQLAIAVAVGSVAGQHWSISHALMPAWLSVAFGSGTFVAVGSSGAIGASADGQQWTPHDTDPHTWVSVAHGAAGWVAVAADGAVGISADGVRWSVDAGALPGADATTALTQVVFGDGVYVVGSRASGAWISADGATWTALPHSFAWLAFGAGTFVGVDANGQTLASNDARAWAPVSPGQTPGSIAYANGRFLAASGSQLASSADGRTWVPVGTTPDATDPLFSAAGVFYQSRSQVNGVYQPGVIGETADGQQWSDHDESAVGIASGFAAGPGTLVVVSADGSIGSGPDADHLQPAVPRSNGHLVSAGYVRGRYVAVSASGDLLASADGQAWSATSLGTAAWPDAPRTFSAAALAGADSGRLVVAGFVPTGNGHLSPAVLFSDDGVAWNAASEPQDMFATLLLNDGARFLAIANDGVYASPDGSAWSLQSRIALQSGQWIAKVVQGPGLYLAVGHAGLAATSPDAIHWTVAPIVMDVDRPGMPLDFSGAVWTGQRFVAVAANGHVATSPDGQHWRVSASATTRPLGAIAVSTQGELVAVGEQDAAETSVDAIHWTLRDSPSPATLHDVVFANGAFMAVGDDSVIEMSSH